jgi:hypothetical protein
MFPSLKNLKNLLKIMFFFVHNSKQGPVTGFPIGSHTPKVLEKNLENVFSFLEIG